MVSNVSSTTASRSLRFGPSGRFELRPAEYRLLVDGQPATLGGRALDLLLALAARPGDLLTKTELLEIVWPGLVVEENNLRVQINTLRRLLGEGAIATVPGRGYRLSLAVSAEAGTAEGAAAAVSSASGRQALFGRETDLADLEAALAAVGRCVTLVGTPGVGKSSLARLAAARWRQRSAWVDLAALTHGDQVAGAIARALGGQLEPAHVAAGLADLVGEGEALLLVLDNAEHLIDGCAACVTQLRGASNLHLLVTSLQPLAVGDEQVIRLAPLEVDPAADAREGALAMLLARIAEADRRFQVAAAALPLLAALCRQLDGLPLALEMAAARVPLMGVQAVHDALAERFSLLSRGRPDAPARHRTLRDALDWSHGLLSPPEQRLFRALGVFAGGFTLDLAIALHSDAQVQRWDVVDGLAVLVERSLVTVSGEDPPRYRLLESLRALALEKLAAAAEQDTPGDALQRLRRRHAESVSDLFARGESSAQCLAEMDNAREAFLWARDHDFALAVRLSTHAAVEVGFTIWRQEVTEWMLSLHAGMQQAAGQALPLQVQAHWWLMLSYVLNLRRDPAARPASRRAVALWRQLDDPDRLQAALASRVRAITEPCTELDEACAELRQSVAAGADSPRALLRVNGALAEAARVQDDLPALLACREQELQMAKALGMPDMAQAAESNVCAALLELGRGAEAAQRVAALMQHIEADGGDDNGNVPWAINVQIEALVLLGQLESARVLLPRSLATSRRFGTTVAWQGILLLVLAERRFEVAGRLAGHVGRLLTARGSSPDRDEMARLALVRSAVQGALGAAAAQALEEQGRMASDQAVQALALAGAAEPGVKR